MIDTDILRQFGWSEELIDSVINQSKSLRETASKIPQINDLVRHEMVASGDTYPGDISDQKSMSDNTLRVK